MERHPWAGAAAGHIARAHPPVECHFAIGTVGHDRKISKIGPRAGADETLYGIERICAVIFFEAEWHLGQSLAVDHDRHHVITRLPDTQITRVSARGSKPAECRKFHPLIS